MTTGFNFWDVSPVWTFVLALTAISVSMLIANLLIRIIKPLRHALIPAPVLGGFLLLAFISIYKAASGGVSPISGSVLEMLTYHCLGLGFVATSLKNKKKGDKGNSTKKSTFDASLICVTGYLIQAVVGLAISMLLALAISNVWPASGLLVPMGYGQGPGQAFNWGNVYSQYDNSVSAFGAFQNGTSFGLSIAAMGFVAASVGGIIYLNVQKRKGNIKMVKHADAQVEDEVSVESFIEENEIAVSGTIDKGSVQFGLIVMVYALSFALIYGISKICDAAGVNFLINTVKPLFWGFNFILGSIMASLTKVVMNKMSVKGVIKKKYVNNYLMDRFSGLFFDVMVVAAIGAIDLSAFGKREFIVPLLLMCIVAGFVTYYYVKHVCKKAFPTYKEESFLAMFGMLCGTASTGVILLREIDPYFKSPACTDMVYQMGFSIVLGAPMLISMGMAAKSWKMLLIWFAIYIVMFVAMYALIRREDINRLIKKRKGILIEEDGTSEETAVADEIVEAVENN